MGSPGSPETHRARTRTDPARVIANGRGRGGHPGMPRPRDAWSLAARSILPPRRVGARSTGHLRAAERPDACFRATVADILKLDPVTPACPACAPVTASRSRAAPSPTSPLTLRQLLTAQGVVVLGLILQPKLLYPDAPPPSAMPIEPDLPTDDGAASIDRAERSVIQLEFRARMAAARICSPRDALGAALRMLSRERRACLQALHDRTAARRRMLAHERLARDCRRAVALTARGVPRRPERETSEDTNARVKAAILKDIGA